MSRKLVFFGQFCEDFIFLISLFFLPVGMEQILAIRAQVEELDIDEESLAYLGEIGQQTSLRSVFTHSISSSVFFRCFSTFIYYLDF